MSKNIVICSDGTGNSGGKGNGTNVWRVFEAVNRDLDTRKQVAFYDDGVGTESFKPLKIIGGAFGWGLARNVRQLYAEICRIYDPGDRIFYFGFSRGAFTVRTLMGWILGVGLVDRKCARDNQELDELVAESYRTLRSHFLTLPQRLVYGDDLTKKRQKALDPKLHQLTDEQRQRLGHFIGVWDTVDAVGFPISGVAKLWNNLVYRFKFPDYKLHADARNAFHALAIDDERATFHPLLWDEKPDEKSTPPPAGQVLEQVWFSGMHSNVGGGYPQDGMAYVPLVWIMDAAKNAGLEFTQGLEQLYRERANPMEKMYNSRSGFSMYYRFKPRSVTKLSSENGTDAVIHPSVLSRAKQAPAGYAPRQIPADSKTWSSSGAEPDQKLRKAVKSGLKKIGLSETDQIGAGWDRFRVSLQIFIVVFTLLLLACAVGAGLFKDNLAGTYVGNWLDRILPNGNWTTWASVVGVFLALSFAIALTAESISHRLRSRFWTRAIRRPKGQSTSSTSIDAGELVPEE